MTSSRTRRRCVRVAPIAQNSPLLPPRRFGPCLSPNVADRPQPGYPLQARWAVTRRLPDGLRPHPSHGFPGSHGVPEYPVLASVSRGCPGGGGRLVTCYSPVRHSIHARRRLYSFDLHVLGAPLAFILSQDQTLSGSRGRMPSNPS